MEEVLLGITHGYMGNFIGLLFIPYDYQNIGGHSSLLITSGWMGPEYRTLWTRVQSGGKICEILC